jgi:hypothetical protein
MAYVVLAAIAEAIWLSSIGMMSFCCRGRSFHQKINVTKYLRGQAVGQAMG